jgi:hypothetical protein
MPTDAQPIEMRGSPAVGEDLSLDAGAHNFKYRALFKNADLNGSSAGSNTSTSATSGALSASHSINDVNDVDSGCLKQCFSDPKLVDFDDMKGSFSRIGDELIAEIVNDIQATHKMAPGDFEHFSKMLR